MGKKAASNYQRSCPGEAYAISEAVCWGRQQHHYPKCKSCPFAEPPPETPSAARASSKHTEPTMLDKIFKAYDIRGTYPDALNENLAWKIGYACAQFFRSQPPSRENGPNGSALAVGRDMRRSGRALCSAFIQGVNSAGMAVIEIGMIDTSQIYFAINHLGTVGGVQTTASHNPANYNGFKISGPGGRPIGLGTGLEEIKRLAAGARTSKVTPRDDIKNVDLTGPYRDFVRKFLDRSQRKLKLVVDASNGMAGKWFPILFDDCPWEVKALNFEHRGEFVHDPNPLVEANLQQLKQAVRRRRADLGICFDGDADRCVIVDETATVVGGDILTALLAGQFLADNPGATVVYDLRSSRVVKEEIERAGGLARRERVGHAFMKKALADENAVFGGELSGHFYFRENWYCDSGFLAFVQVMNILSRQDRPFGELLGPLKRYFSSGERNFRTDDQDARIRELAQQYGEAEVDYLDGITVQFANWWFNVRKSNTEPLLRLNLEANSASLLEEKLSELSGRLGEPVEH